MEEGNTDIVALLNRHALADLAAKGKAGARPLDTGAAQAGAAQESPIEDLANVSGSVCVCVCGMQRAGDAVTVLCVM